MSDSRPVESPDRKDLLKRALVRMDQLERELQAARDRAGEPIAIIGMGCRFPGGASSPERFRELLYAGFDATCAIPEDRWDVDAYYDPDPDSTGTMYVRRGAFLTEPVDHFDAAFFGIAPREADEMDPQQRLLTEVVWETIENAGQSPDALRGSSTGVFVGMAAHDWSRMQAGGGDTGGIGTYYGTGAAHSVAAGRISYLLGLKGPALTIDTACSSSLIAFHEACQSLRAGETRMAVAAGVSLILAPDGHVIASRGRMLSPRGYCSTFDASADGYVRGEGCAVVLLKRLSDARADGDRILAVVRGTAANQDGRSGGLTVPSGTAQEEVMRSALASSTLKPADVDYVEAHGTGTELGDPIEVHALAAVHAGRPAERPLLIGSVKTNVGHLEGAAGLAGVVKTVIALGEDTIPPHLHFETPNPHIAWDSAPIAVTAKATPWPRPDKRVAGVSSFGFSGTNVHVVLEAPSEEVSAPAEESAGAGTGVPLVIPISARDPEGLAQVAGLLLETLEGEPTADLAAVARTLARGRAHWEERAAIVADDREDLVAGLRRIAAGELPSEAGVAVGTANRKRVPGVAFLFTGQGSQRPGMGRELLAAEPVFRAAVERCDAVVTQRLGVSIAELMRAAPDDAEAAATLRRTEVTQPALFVLEYALTELWRSWGVDPRVVLGHSIGEFAAACAAGVLAVEDALTLVIERARLMGSLPAGGEMATVFADEERVRSLIGSAPGGVDVAAVNAPGTVVVSGTQAAVAAVLERAAAEGIQGRRLEVSHAFHSRAMEPIVDAFARVAAQVPHSPPRIDVIAAATGERAGATTLQADYWARQIRQPVLFARSVQALRGEGATVLVEVGPAPVLLSLAASCPGSTPDELRLPTLRPGSDAARAAREALGALYVSGVPVDWKGVYPGPLRPLPLPTYPFRRSRHWFAERRRRDTIAEGHPLLGRRVESPHFAGSLFDVTLREDDPSWVAEHRVFGRAVLPAAAYVEMCRAAVAEVIGHRWNPARLRILEPLVVSGETRVQTIVDTDARVLRIASRDPSGHWHTHAEAEWEEVSLAPGSSEALDGAADSAWEPVDVDALLARIEENGVAYGPAFRGLGEVRRAGGAARGVVAAGALPRRERTRYGVHPAVLDAAFQLCGACVDGGDAVFLPVGVDELRFTQGDQGSEGAAFRARAMLREGGPDGPSMVCDVDLDDGVTTLRVRGLRFQRAAKAAPSPAARVADWLYEPVWERLELAAAGPHPSRLIVVGKGPLATALVAAGEAAGVGVDLLTPASAADQLADHVQADATVVVVAEESESATSPDPLDALHTTLSPLLAVARHAATAGRPQTLVVVTRAACSVSADEPVDPAQAALRAMAHTVAAELPGAPCRRVDIGAAVDAGTAAAGILAVLSSPPGDDRLALRADGWHAERLERIPPGPSADARPAGDYQLQVSARGDLGTLHLAPASVGEPGPGQLTLRVEATGLNFRDVLNALDMYPGDAGALGSECVGVVEKVGEGVAGFAIGDRVMSVTPAGFCSRVNTSALLTVPVPAGMTAGEAASLPIAFLTADWALLVLAGLKAGERVLIHAAAGGVGLAAVQLARAAGAEVFATAGSPRKRALLRRMGVERIYDSRSLEFRDEILRDTGGEGVHVVLNSLADDFIPASLDVLAANGRFIEIGKTGVWDAARVAEARPGATYHVLYLGEACEREPERVRERFVMLADRFASGELHPLPVRGFAVDDAVGAFRYMAQARHIGKVVLYDRPDRMHEMGDGAVWITGGLGGVGLETAANLAERGARRLVLTGRSEPSPATAARLAELRAAGAEVEVLTGDVASREEVNRILDTIASLGWRLDHVVHAAAVLDDAALPRQSWERFPAVLGAKALGAWNLHQATIGLPLRSFVLCSAGAGLLGSPGQANYVAANGFLDGLAHLRRSQGLPSTSIAWGPWAKVGMAARAGLDWSEQGMRTIDPEAGVAALLRLASEDVATPAVLPIDWKRFPARASDASVLPFFRLVAGELPLAAEARGGADWRVLLEATAAPERQRRLEQLLAGEVAGVLGISSARPPSARQGLTDVGMDSLMAVELSNRVGRAVGEKLPTTLAFEYPTIEQLAVHLLERLDLATAAEVAVGSADENAAVVEEMSEEEASSALLQELEQIGY